MSEIIAHHYRELRPLVDIVGDRLLFIAAVLVALLGAALIGVQLIDILGGDASSFQRI
ncbi:MULTISPECIES: hypothetical protein [Thioclava]|uniref:hypothetical protein n=1 Tax=Thioclava TaxID=285107 RepID=UPI0012FDCA38|nr:MULTISPECIES: hypothetical protein [Thioclava]WGT50055.1 hypothetical protein P0N61_17390 [Thioclava nitratireducens]